MKFKMGGSGIYIKPENKGKFTATKKATGKSTEELTHSKNPVTKKRAIFAQNAAKWKHDEGTKKLATADSTAYYSKQMEKFMKKRSQVSIDKAPPYDQKVNKAMSDMYRQTKKGKPGYDANGHPIMMKMKNGSKNVKFPDLNKDGEITRADVLTGIGVLPVKKMQIGSKELKTMRKNLPKSMTPTPDNLKNKVKGVVKGVKDFIKDPKKTLNKLNPIDNAMKSMDKKMCGSKGMKYAEGTKSIKFKKKPMMKRADGSYSQRGLWDNLRSKAAENKKTGAKPKAPTKAMLSQEKKINSK